MPSTRSHQIMAGIADPGTSRRERDVAGFLEEIEQHGRRGSRESSEDQCDNKNLHGIPHSLVAS